MVHTTMPSVLTLVLVSGVIMTTVQAGDTPSGTNLTAQATSNVTEIVMIINELINQVVMDGFAGELGNLAYNISNIMVADLELEAPTVNFTIDALALGLELRMFDVNADYELQLTLPRLSRTITRDGEMEITAETFAIDVTFAFPSFNLTSCNTDAEISLSVSGSAIVQRILQTSLIDVIEVAVERAVCVALGGLAEIAGF